MDKVARKFKMLLERSQWQSFFFSIFSLIFSLSLFIMLQRLARVELLFFLISFSKSFEASPDTIQSSCTPFMRSNCRYEASDNSVSTFHQVIVSLTDWLVHANFYAELGWSIVSCKSVENRLTNRGRCTRSNKNDSWYKLFCLLRNSIMAWIIKQK